MAAPGLGIGDLIAASNFIYKKAIQYKDAVKEFDEIAHKTKSTTVIIKRLDDESRLPLSLVDRAGPEACKQLEDMLASLRDDLGSLEKLVKKYDHVHISPGRRLMFVLMESDGLSELRRKIGLHEQTLQLWYMALVQGSLRRLESGQEEIIDALKGLPDDIRRKIEKEVRHGSHRSLEKELRRSGVSVLNIQENMGLAQDYVAAKPRERRNIESVVRTASHARNTSEQRARMNSYAPYEEGAEFRYAPGAFPVPPMSPPYDPDEWRGYSRGGNHDSGLRRSRSARDPREPEYGFRRTDSYDRMRPKGYYRGDDDDDYDDDGSTSDRRSSPGRGSSPKVVIHETKRGSGSHSDTRKPRSHSASQQRPTHYRSTSDSHQSPAATSSQIKLVRRPTKLALPKEEEPKVPLTLPGPHDGTGPEPYFLHRKSKPKHADPTTPTTPDIMVVPAPPLGGATTGVAARERERRTSGAGADRARDTAWQRGEEEVVVVVEEPRRNRKGSDSGSKEPEVRKYYRRT